MDTALDPSTFDRTDYRVGSVTPTGGTVDNNDIKLTVATVPSASSVNITYTQGSLTSEVGDPIGSFSIQAVVDTTAPTVSEATVSREGTGLTLEFNESLRAVIDTKLST